MEIIYLGGIKGKLLFYACVLNVRHKNIPFTIAKHKCYFSIERKREMSTFVFVFLIYVLSINKAIECLQLLKGIVHSSGNGEK